MLAEVVDCPAILAFSEIAEAVKLPVAVLTDAEIEINFNCVSKLPVLLACDAALATKTTPVFRLEIMLFVWEVADATKLIAVLTFEVAVDATKADPAT